MSKALAIFARIYIVDHRGGTESESNKDRLQQRYAICVFYYSGDCVHQISVWALVLFGKSGKNYLTILRFIILIKMK